MPLKFLEIYPYHTTFDEQMKKIIEEHNELLEAYQNYSLKKTTRDAFVNELHDSIQANLTALLIMYEKDPYYITNQNRIWLKKMCDYVEKKLTFHIKRIIDLVFHVPFFQKTDRGRM